jgi:threonine/homoserine/homoserine lactone efflux protein
MAEVTVMPEFGTLVAFGVAVVVMQLIPGPDMMLVVARGIGQGRKIALCTVLGMTLLAGSVQLPLLMLGVASLLQSSPFAFSMLQWLGAGYLIWLGGRLLWTTSRYRIRTAAPPHAAAWKAIREGAINNLTNPKPLLFMFALLPQFVDPTHGPVWRQLLVLGLMQKLCGFVILSSAALASGAVGNWLARRPGIIAWQERFTGLVMVALGIRLLLVGDARPTRG